MLTGRGITQLVLRTGSDLTDWERIFTNAGITTASAKIYAQTFSSEGITRDTMHMLDRTMLKELGIKNMGEVLIILKLAKENPASPTTHVKPTAKPPQLNSEMTPQQFRKFKLVNQVAWAYSLSPIMLPFWELVKKNSNFVWNEGLEKAFQQSKQVIVGLVKKGVTTFDINRTTCLAPDWSKDGMGFLLLQKHCTCPTEKAPVCCPDGWHIVFAGSRFCTDAERRYAPIEGEAATIAWSLEKCRLFIIGCPWNLHEIFQCRS